MGAYRKSDAVMTIQEASELLGVSAVTLRRWDATGKFRAHRHPCSNYRIYKRADVMKLRARLLGKS